MKKLYLLVAIASIALAFTGCSGSDSAAVGGGDKSGTYVVGTYTNFAGSTNYAAVWKNGVRTNLTIDYTATGMFVTDSNVYITGYYGGGSVRPFYWKDGTKTDLSSTYNGQTSGVVVDSGGVVYISGYMDISGYTPGYWKDGTWNALDFNTSGWTASTGRTSCIAVDSNYVYVGGRQTDYDTGYDVGTVWIYNKSTGVKVAALTFADPANYEASYVTAIFVKSGVVYAVGTKSIKMDTTEDYYPTYWTCTDTPLWNTVETLMMAVSASDQITSIVVDSSDNVIVGGRNADQPTIWRSNNNSGSGGWDSPLKTTTDGSVNGLYLSGSDLYSGGFYNDATTNSNAFSANGTTVTDLISTSTGDYGVGYAVFVK